ncbi:hypothetical protein QQM41_04405 [Acetobacter sp. AC2005]|uniref:hypothetical protein n=1 Tax=Acetobacter sp. AC2005 TaxID=3134142 RepID=UPI0030D4F2C2
MQGQYQPRAPGIAAGQSARNTTATYFDYQGIMRTAQPGELRPNYVYRNGVWVQDGWLREGASQNCMQCGNTNMGAYGAFPESYLITKDAIPNITSVDAPSDTQVMIGSVYVLLTHPETTANRLDMWWAGGSPDGVYVDLTNRVVAGTSAEWHISCEDVGTALRVWLQGGPNHSTIWSPVFIPRNGDAVMACFQNEALTSDGNPTSWMPYGQTRGAD